ncbi:hypothetical protein FJZ36_18515, partial [Candidatus Poribacteria bacterium]|nr:hypothetical protein [Candidatus Poribacteria bacterium]
MRAWSRWGGAAPLNRAELMAVYTCVSVGSSLSGVDRMFVLVPLLGHASWFATPENDWAGLFQQHIPRWLTVSDRSVLSGYYNGLSTLYTGAHLRAWLPVVAWWSVFLVAAHLVMLCLNIVVRRQWIEGERLSYPVIRLPVEITEPRGAFFRSEWMWVGFAVGAVIDIVNGV